jgi:hypothetical protein
MVFFASVFAVEHSIVLQADLHEDLRGYIPSTAIPCRRLLFFGIISMWLKTASIPERNRVYAPQRRQPRANRGTADIDIALLNSGALPLRLCHAFH